MGRAPEVSEIPSFDVAFVAARAVVGDREQACVIGVQDGRIALLAEHGTELDARDTVRIPESEVLLPGLVDTHVHINEPGRTEWEGFETATLAAAAGGVTTLVDMPLNSVPATTSLQALDAKRAAAAGQAHVDVGFWGGAVPGNFGELAALHEAGVLGFKAFLIDSGVPEFAALDEAGLLAAMRETGRLGALLMAHCEDPGVIAAAPEPQGRSYEAFLRSRPAAAEDLAIGHLLAAARASGGRAHVAHLSSSSALASLRAARAEGLAVSVETCPHYLALEAGSIPDGATQFKCCPPIREGWNQDLLWEALFAGEIEMIVSDHSPSPASLKRLESGDFGAAWGGIASLQLGLPIIWTAASARSRSLADVVRWMSRAPADLVGLSHKGRIEVGADADLVAFDPQARFTVDPERLLHRHPVSAYAGLELRGMVRRTWLRGAPAGGDERRHGRLILRGEQR